MQDSADTTRFWWRCHVLDSGYGRDRSDSQRSGGIEHTHRPVVFGASFLRIRRGPLPTTQLCHQTEKESLALPGFLLALPAPIAGAEDRSIPLERSGDGRDS